MEQLLKISIVTVNYNGAAFLERTINSVLSQGYPNLEYIIIDGGSTDRSIDIITKYEKHLHYWISEPDKGMYDALQKGFEKTSGEIMGWINSDDVFHPGAFFRIAEIFSRYQQIRWLTGVPTALDEYDNVMIPRCDEFPVWSKLRVHAGDYKWIQQESTVWRRSLWIQSGGTLDTTLRYAGDFNLWLNFFETEKLYSAPILIGGFRIRREGQISMENIDSYMKEVRKCLNRHRTFMSYLYLPFIFADRILINTPLVKTIYYKSGLRRLLGFPQKMVFNRKNQKLELA